MREPLLGIFALLAEWQVLMDVTTEPSVAQLKVSWWHEELQRLAHSKPIHPISVFLANLPGADQVDFAPLGAAAVAVSDYASGTPLEHRAQLADFADALYGAPLRVAAQFATPLVDGLCGPTRMLAEAHYLERALREQRREARAGRIAFPVDELLAAGIENGDWDAATPVPRLKQFIEQSTERAAILCTEAARGIPSQLASQQRHLVVIASITRRRLYRAARPGRDLWTAWRAARRASTGRCELT